MAVSIRRSRPAQVDLAGVYSVVQAIKQHQGPMTVTQLAPLLGISRDALYDMANKGQIPVLIIPGVKVTKFDPATVVYWLIDHNPILRDVQKAS